MNVSPGTRLGPYEVTAQIGAGGMGEVYRATDTNLKRAVAIKVLPESVAADAERLARFQREAEVLAALNHPNIAQIYGLERSGRMTALVMELVEGPTLADRIAQGAIPIDEALPIARQIAEALEGAHEQGIIHRDLKPPNIKLRPDGTVKVLDFGLAKVREPMGAMAGSNPMSPTITTPAMTQAGVILGTSAYMSPEQARGKTVDKRADIWAFGVVLYEMLTGRRCFAGDSVTDVLAAVVRAEPNWAALPASVPPTVRRLLRRCLEKDVRRRLRDAGDARLEIDDALAPGAADSVAPVQARAARLVPWVVAAAAVVLAIVTGAAAWRSPPRPSVEAAGPEFSRIARLTTGPAREFGPAISPDGKWVAYVSNVSGSTDVWVKFLGGGEAVNLTASAGLDVTLMTGISGLDISPDATRVAVMAKLRGSTNPFSTWELPAPLPGVPRKLLDDGFLGMRWSPDGRRITFIRAGAAAGDSLWVADADGTNRKEIIAARDGIHVHWPTWSPDGFIYFSRASTNLPLNLEVSEVFRIDARGGTMEPVVSTLRRAMQAVPFLGGGDLIYAANPTAAEMSLWWRPGSGGPSRRITTGVGEYAEPRVSADGRTLVATLYDFRQSLVSVATTPSQSGRMTAVTDGFGGDLDPSLSPTSDQLVFSSSRTGNRHLWIARGDGSALRPLTSGAAHDDRPAFSPDGRQVAFVSDRDGKRSVWLINADGGTPRKLADVSPTGSLSWSPRGDQLVYAASTGTWPGLWSASLVDGQIRRIPTPGAVAEPAWCPTRDLIAYLEPATTGAGFQKLMFVDSTGRPMLSKAPPAPPISGGFVNGTTAWSPDGRRLAVVSQNTNAPTSIWILEPDADTSFRKLAELPVGPRIRGMTWTRDGSALVIGQHDTTSDIIVLDRAQ